MKRKLKIIGLIVLIFFSLSSAFMFWMMRRMTYGVDDYDAGNEAIPASASQKRDPAVEGKADWPNWRGPAFNGRSGQKGILTDWTNGLQKKWDISFLCQGKSGMTHAAPVIKGNRLIVPGREPDNDLVFCLDTASGAIIWKGSYKSDPPVNYGKGSRATPFIDGDRVYTFGRGGDLVCWDLTDGELLWHRHLSDLGGVAPKWGHSSSPLVYGEIVIVQGGGNCRTAAFNKNSGEPVWVTGTGNAGYAAAAVFGSGKETRILAYHAAGLSALDPETGDEKWAIPWVTSWDVNATTPAVSDDHIFITSGYGTGGQVIKADVSGVKIVWTNKAIAAQHSDPVMIDGFIYGFSGDSIQNKGDLVCVELTTGKEKWRSQKAGNGTMIYADGYLITLSIKGDLFLIKPDPSGFNIVASFPKAVPGVKQQAWTVPVIANGRLFLRYRQRLICYTIAE